MKTRLSLVLSASVVVGCSVGGYGAAPDQSADALDPNAPGRAPGASGASTAPQSPPAGGSSVKHLGVSASPGFGMTVNATSTYPTVKYGSQRIWDSPPFQWGTLQTAACADVSTCAAGYDATNLSRFDAYLEQLKTNGVEDVWYTMARTPSFASSAPNDTSCNYSDSTKGGPGQCDRPKDLNVDGTGTNQTFRRWYAFFALRNNDATYRATHAHIRFWEPWNEPDTAAFWGDGAGGHGSYDALVRLMQDTECLIVGAVGTGTITKTGETCAQVQASVGLKAPIDPTAIVVSPSYHAKEASLSQYQNFLYCNNAPKTSCTSGDAGAKSIMAFNLHMKPGAECVTDASKTNCTTASSVEPAYASYIASFEGILQPTELTAFHDTTLPLLDGEASYSPTGFVGPFTDHDMAASWLPRFFLYGRSLGVTGNQWYTWNEVGGNTEFGDAWNTLYDAVVGATMPTCSNVGTVYTCAFTKGGTSFAATWDIAQSCSAGVCTTSQETVSDTWTTYRDLTGTDATCTSAAPCAIKGGKVPIGIKPVLLQP